MLYNNEFLNATGPFQQNRAMLMKPNVLQEENALPADPYPYTYPQNLPMALELIMEALAGEREDRIFYARLISAASTMEDREIISGIRNDEMKHYELFRKIYYELTGELPKAPQTEEDMSRMTYCQGLQKALKGELAAVVKYRKILFAMQDRRHINMLTEIITDEIRHSVLYNYLYSKNTCFESGR